MLLEYLIPLEELKNYKMRDAVMKIYINMVILQIEKLAVKTMLEQATRICENWAKLAY